MMTQEQLLEVTKGDENAANFLAAFQDKAHLLDDVLDQDHPRSPDEHYMTELNWLLTLTSNPFVQQHSAKLVPVMALGINAWADSNVMQKSVKRRDRMAADVVKGFYHEILWLVALICGGYDHMRVVSLKYRNYNFEEDLT